MKDYSISELRKIDEAYRSILGGTRRQTDSEITIKRVSPVSSLPKKDRETIIGYLKKLDSFHSKLDSRHNLHRGRLSAVESEKLQKARMDAWKFLYVAIDADGNIVGFVSYVEGEYDDCLTASFLFVEENSRGKGIGKRLLKESMNDLKERDDCKFVLIGVSAYNRKAKTLYERLGFKDVHLSKIRRI